jgi:hypothetical protein
MFSVFFGDFFPVFQSLLFSVFFGDFFQCFSRYCFRCFSAIFFSVSVAIVFGVFRHFFSVSVANVFGVFRRFFSVSVAIVWPGWQFHLCRKASKEQGDQIGRIFADWTIDYFWQFLQKNTEV